MSSPQPDISYQCARCGADLGNGGVQSCAIVVDLDPATGEQTQRNLRFCRDRPDPDNPGKNIHGCRDRVFTKKALRHYHETRTA